MHKTLNIFRVLCLASGITLSLSPSAKMVTPSYEDIPVLSPESQHSTACSRIGNFFTRAHYKVVDLNADFADRIIERYLSYLDYTRTLLT